MIVEAVCCSVRDAILAEAAGAHRIELCSALEVGGLTPSAGMLSLVCESVSIPVMAMVRPRPGDFTYDDSEWQVILADCRALLAAGAKGIVFGALIRAGTAGPLVVDPRSTDIANCAPGSCTFHRAIDATSDLIASAEEVMALGFARILSSGGKASALEGASTLRTMRGAGATILACGKVRSSNVPEIVAQSGTTEVHLGPRRPVGGPFLPGIAEFGTRTVLDEAEIRAVVQALQ